MPIREHIACSVPVFNSSLRFRTTVNAEPKYRV